MKFVCFYGFLFFFHIQTAYLRVVGSYYQKRLRYTFNKRLLVFEYNFTMIIFLFVDNHILLRPFY